MFAPMTRTAARPKTGKILRADNCPSGLYEWVKQQADSQHRTMPAQLIHIIEEYRKKYA